MKIRAGNCVAVLLGLAVTGCAMLPGGGPAPVDAYDLSAPAVSKAGQRRARMQLLVPEPSAIKVLDGQNIVVKTPDGGIQFLGGGRWADRLPRIVQARLADLLQRSGRFGGVGTPGEGLAIDYQVLTDLQAFEIRTGKRDEARVALFVRLLDDRTGVVRAARNFDASAPVTGSSDRAYAAALDRAFSAAMGDLAEWTAAHI